MTELVAGILSDAQTLIKQQFAMLRAEIKEEVRQTTAAGKCFSIGVALGAVGVLFLAIAAVYLLSRLAPDLALWACWAIVGGVILACGIAAFVVGLQRLKAVTPVPEKSLNALQENLSWIANRQS